MQTRTLEGRRPIQVPPAPRKDASNVHRGAIPSKSSRRPIQVTPRSPNETSEFRNLAQTYTTLAENEDWIAVHLDRTVQRRKHGNEGAALAEVEEQILRCLGAAVILRWNTVPTKLQKELFDCASSIGNLQSPTSF
jgi:hypothetical protein